MLVRRQKNCASPERCISSEGRGFLTAEGNPAEPPVIKFVASPHRLGKRWLARPSDDRSRCWLLTHNVYYRIFFRACLHEQSQKMRSEPIMPHYVNVASGSFFGVGFCFVPLAALVYFFANTFYQ